MIAANNQAYSVFCSICGNEHIILADEKDLEDWLLGKKYIQDALAYLSAGDRELLISGTCDTCWNQLYPNTGDSEDD